MVLNKVVLPIPLSPTRATRSCFFISILIFLNNISSNFTAKSSIFRISNPDSHLGLKLIVIVSG